MEFQIKQGLLNSLRFILFSISGVLLYLFSCLNIWIGIVCSQENHISLLPASILAFVGLCLMLGGVGKLKNWRYYVLFMLIPVLFFGYISFDKSAQGGKVMPIFIAIGISIVALYFARRFAKQRPNCSHSK